MLCHGRIKNRYMSNMQTKVVMSCWLWNGVVIYVKATLVCCGLGIVIIYHISEYFTKFLQWHSSVCSVVVLFD